MHWSALGQADAPDVAILAATRGGKPSVVQIRTDDLNPDAIGRTLTQALRQMAEKLEAGALLSVDPKRTRLRLLPLPPRS